MKKIIEANAKYVRDSLVEVTYNSSHSWVVARDENDETVFFLDGYQADEFIDEAKKLYNENDVSMDDVVHHLAKQYLY